jgi:hypothetical protein
MKIRAISANEIEPFTNAFDADESNVYFKRDLARKWDTHQTRPEWCFVAEQEGRIIGRVVYEAPASKDDSAVAQTMGYLGLAWNFDYLQTGQTFIRHTLSIMRTHGMRTVKKTIYSAMP